MPFPFILTVNVAAEHLHPLKTKMGDESLLTNQIQCRPLLFPEKYLPGKPAAA
ncbi:MAG: hypothetical protein U0T36_03485 [Saprospiraceae bacterium]